jgi:hypothetical protein
MVRHSTDQVASAITHRYTGPKALSNVASDMKKVIALLNVEDKHVDTSIGTTSVTNTASLVVAVSGPIQGITGSTRTGDSIKINKIDLNIHFNYSSGTSATSIYTNQYFNWYLVRYLKTLSNTPFAIGDMLNNDAGGNVTPMSLVNTDLIEDFQLMASGQVNVIVQKLGTVSTNDDELRFVSHECSFHQSYTGAGIASISDNQMFLVFTALNPINAGGVSSVQVQARTWFIDN